MKVNSLGSHVKTLNIPKHNFTQKNDIQIEVIEHEITNRNKSHMSIIYDYWYLPNILFACLGVIFNVFYLIQQ